MSYNFRYCQKIVVLSTDKTKVLLCKRRGELDYDGVFSLIGGKMETSDVSIIDGMRREKDEEVGAGFRIRLLPTLSYNILFKTSDEHAMILPHYLAYHTGGEIVLNESEYSEYRWVSLDELDAFEPKIPTIPTAIRELVKLEKISTIDDFIEM